MLANPTQIGRYKINDSLGHGAMGHVYLAYDPFVKRQVAIKLLPQTRIIDSELLARFQREAEIVANLQHACIVSVYDFGEYEGQPYIVMHYMAGGSLKERVEAGPLSLNETAPIIERVAEALDIAHEKKIVHRDIKPGNILFDQLGQAYLADFGIAKIQADFAQQLTANLVLGTPEYMSPEQVRDQVVLDGRSDVYGLGIVVFQMLTGEFPFRTNTPMGTAVAHLMDPIPNICDIRKDLPAEADWLIKKVLAKDPDKRFQTAGEFARSLRLVADGRGYHLRIAGL